jgi:acyl-coenzyme A thioesterase PaaI-like protein
MQVKNNLTKQERLSRLIIELKENPFLTDEELTKIFSVSIQTVRLDRLELGIPELRERMKKVAVEVYGQVKSLSGAEIVGELVDIELDQQGISLLHTTDEMAFRKTKIIRGHHLFAQANSLAVALINADVALTGSAKVSYKRPVLSGERVIAKALVEEKKGKKYNVTVNSKVKDEEVFSGSFVIFAVDEKGGL